MSNTLPLVDSTPPTFTTVIESALRRLRETLLGNTPSISGEVLAWMDGLTCGRGLEAYFTSTHAFPTLLLPWWLEQSLNRGFNPEIQEQLAYSSINGYYFIRLLDNVMDHEDTVERKLLPMSGLFHYEFHCAYQHLFPCDHDFWRDFKAIWLATAEAASRDATMDAIDADTFIACAAKKVSAALIPVLAACHYFGRQDIASSWTELVHRLARWHQMENDLFDWHKDYTHGNKSYVLSEAEKRRGDQSTEAWFIHGGFDYGCRLLVPMIVETLNHARTLGSTGLIDFLEQRAQQFERRRCDVVQGLQALKTLNQVLQ